MLYPVALDKIGYRPRSLCDFVFGGCNAVGGGGGSSPPDSGDDTLVDSNRIVMNDSGATFNQTIEHKLVVQFRDNVVESTDDLVVKLASTEFTTQVRQTRAYPSGYMSIGTVSFLVPAGTAVNGESLVDVYKRAGTRSTTSAISLADIGAQNITVDLTNVTDYGGNADGSGVFRCVLADYIEAGEPATTVLDRGPVFIRGRTRAIAKDTTGGAAHAAGLHCIFEWTAVQISGALAFTRFYATLFMGDIANGDPDVRRCDVAVKVNGSTVAGGTHTGMYIPYYSKVPISRSNGRPFCTDAAKHSPFRNVLPFADWSSRTLRRLPPNLAHKFNDSGTALVTAASVAEAQSIPTSGGDKGKVTVSNVVWLSDADAGGNACRLKATVYPSDGSFTFTEESVVYLGADTGSGKRWMYPTRADAVAGTNKLLQGTVVAGTSVVLHPAHAPISMPMGARGWSAGGDRAEIGLISSLGWAAIMQPSEAALGALRCNALNLAYAPWNYRGTTTFRVPDIRTEAATYAGLGTGFGYDFSWAIQNTGFRSGMVAPTGHDSGNYYEDTNSGIATDLNHPPAPDYFIAWLHDPETIFEDIAMSWWIGQAAWSLPHDRSPTWNGNVHINGVWANHAANWRGCAWSLRALMAAAIMWPEAVISGNNGERAHLDADEAQQDAVATDVLIRAASHSPNMLEMGILPLHRDVTLSNWQYSPYFMPVVTLLHGYTGRMETVLEAMKPYGLALGGNGGTANGTPGPTRMGHYYPSFATYAGAHPDTANSDLFEAPAGQWDAFGDNGTLAFGSMTINATDNTITVPVSPDRPDDGVQVANGDYFTALRASATPTIDSAIGFGNTKRIRDLSMAGDVATFKLENTPGSGVIDITDATATGVRWSIKRAAERSFGFCNTDLSDLIPVEAMEGAYWLSWSLGGMDAELEVVNDALKNAAGVATEYTATVEIAKHCMSFDICKEAA